mmetsp:Transcript_3063/g.8093  ORF Transcript_3063/g.8093 Transcript_3063/m.8093 type:complete len:218 (+) Transcript_3063:764-1417(+)
MASQPSCHNIVNHFDNALSTKYINSSLPSVPSPAWLFSLCKSSQEGEGAGESLLPLLLLCNVLLRSLHKPTHAHTPEVKCPQTVQLSHTSVPRTGRLSRSTVASIQMEPESAGLRMGKESITPRQIRPNGAQRGYYGTDVRRVQRLIKLRKAQKVILALAPSTSFAALLPNFLYPPPTQDCVQHSQHKGHWLHFLRHGPSTQHSLFTGEPLRSSNAW